MFIILFWQSDLHRFQLLWFHPGRCTLMPFWNIAQELTWPPIHRLSYKSTIPVFIFCYHSTVFPFRLSDCRTSPLAVSAQTCRCASSLPVPRTDLLHQSLYRTTLSKFVLLYFISYFCSLPLTIWPIVFSSNFHWPFSNFPKDSTHQSRIYSLLFL